MFSRIKQFHYDHGLKTLLIRIEKEIKLKINQLVSKKIKRECFVKDILQPPLPFIKIPKTELRLNLVIDQLTDTPLIALAVLFSHKKNKSLRIISTQKCNPSNFFSLLQKNNLPAPKLVEFFSGHNRLETSGLDLFLCSSWEHAEKIADSNFQKTIFYCYDDAFHYKELNALKLALPLCLRPKPLYRLFLASPSTAGLKIIDEAFLRGILDSERWEIYSENEKHIIFSTGNPLKYFSGEEIDLYFSLEHSKTLKTHLERLKTIKTALDWKEILKEPLLLMEANL